MPGACHIRRRAHPRPSRWCRPSRVMPASTPRLPPPGRWISTRVSAPSITLRTCRCVGSVKAMSASTSVATPGSRWANGKNPGGPCRPGNPPPRRPGVVDRQPRPGIQRAEDEAVGARPAMQRVGAGPAVQHVAAGAAIQQVAAAAAAEGVLAGIAAQDVAAIRIPRIGVPVQARLRQHAPAQDQVVAGIAMHGIGAVAGRRRCRSRRRR